MDAALMTLIGPIIRFAIGSILFFGVLLLVLLSQRNRLRKSTFRNVMSGATALWLVGCIAFFYRLATHSG